LAGFKILGNCSQPRDRAVGPVSAMLDLEFTDIDGQRHGVAHPADAAWTPDVVSAMTLRLVRVLLIPSFLDGPSLRAGYSLGLAAQSF